MARRLTEKDLELEVARLRNLELSELRADWEQQHGSVAPRSLRREMLVRSIVWQIQAKAFGGLKPAMRKYLLEFADAIHSKTSVAPAPPIRIRPGTKLIRVWQNKTHTVTALDEGFTWQGKRYRSLSKIARTITGTRWNGLLFFGVKRKPPPKKIGRKVDQLGNSERRDG